MQKNIRFTKETYDYLKEVARTGEYSSDYLGNITQGAVACDFILREDESFKGEDFCFGGRFAIDAQYFLLGKDAGYGEINGVPYDYTGGFYGHLKDTYEKTKEDLIAGFDEFMDAETRIGAERSDLTWDAISADDHVA